MRTTVQREKQLIAMYASQKFAREEWQLNVPVGPVVLPAALRNAAPNIQRIAAAIRRKADLIVVRPAEVLIIEGKIKPDGAELGQLRLYKRLFPSTPEFAAVRALPITLRIVSFVPDEVVRAEAASMGIQFEVFQPPAVAKLVEQADASRQRQFQQGIAALSESLRKP